MIQKKRSKPTTFFRENSKSASTVYANTVFEILGTLWKNGKTQIRLPGPMDPFQGALVSLARVDGPNS